ncbi:MAG: tRNA (5-methylaminomethyl-2-thiouridine)(34)-methyltransferase MnmD [Pseudomonadota bacterium]
MQNQTADVIWRKGDVPVSTRFDDPYYSLENGLAETRYVFLQGNGLPDRFSDGFHIAELGFGTGLNVLASLAAWRATGCSGCLRFTSFEAFPLSHQDMTRALSGVSELYLPTEQLLAVWDPAGGIFPLGEDATLEVIVGDARTCVPGWSGRADAWFLDGFSPAKNPELWEPDLMQAVGAHSPAGTTFATYTAAGHVRRGLMQAGFEVNRVPGYGRKRHMTCGVKR